MSVPNVLFVTHSGAISGAELVLLDLISACPQAGAFLFVHSGLSEALSNRGAKVYHARFGTKLQSITRESSLGAATPLAVRIAAITGELTMLARRYDLVYANSQKAFVVAAIAAWMAKRPLIWHLHDIISSAHFGAGQRRLQVSLANRFSHLVLVPSHAASSAFIAEGGRAELTCVVPNGLAFDAPEPAGVAERGDLGVPKAPVIGVFSRLAPWKGQHVVLRAVARLRNVRCIVVGAAMFGEQAYEESLHKLAEELGISDRVVFFGHRSDVPRLMCAVDIVIHPSVEPEPFGRTLIEAMLVGRPVIATDAGASTEILAGGSMGALVQPGNDQDLADAVVRVLTEGAARKDQLKEARHRAQSLYDVEIMRSAILDKINRVAKEAGQ